MSKTDAKACRERTKHAKEVPNIIGGQLDKERREKQKYDDKVRKANDPEEIKRKKLNGIYQSRASAEKEASTIIIDVCKNLRQEIFKFLTEGFDRKTQFIKLEERIQLCLGLLKEYRKVAENKLVDERAFSNDYTMYEQLFNALIDVNTKFLFFAPKNCFSRNVVEGKIKTLSEIEQNALKEYLERLKQDEKSDYVNEYQVCEFEKNEEIQKVAEMREILTEAKEQAVDKLEDMSDKVSENLYSFIYAEYEEIKNLNGKVETKDIESIFARTKRERHMLNSLVKDNEFVVKRMKKRKINSNENLFNNLINLDIRFATKAPGKCFCRLDLDFKTLGEEEKNIVFDRICRYGLWNIPQFVENYHDVFACQIAKTNNGVNV